MPPTFEEFLDLHLPGLLRSATALTCDPHLAKDVVQNVLIRAERQWERIGAAEHPAAYVRRMIVNEYLSWRRRRVNRDVPLAPLVVARLGEPVADHADRYADADEMRARIARLTRRQRAVIVLRYYENLTDAEIAAELGCTEATVRSHVSHALAALRGQSGLASVHHLRGRMNHVG